MTESTKTIEFKFERTIPAPPDEVFDAWLDPKVPGNPWNYAEKFIRNPTVDGLYYLLTGETPHYGRFTKVERPGQIQHTWMSPYTEGEESLVTVTFKQAGENTLMTLVHSGLPDNENGRKHKEGWNYFLGVFPHRFAKASHANQ